MFYVPTFHHPWMHWLREDNMTESSTRLLSIVVLLLSLAPLASLYILLFSFGLSNPTTGASSSASDASLAASLAAAAADASKLSSLTDRDDADFSTLISVLQDPHASLDDLWRAFLIEFSHKTQQRHYAAATAVVSTAATAPSVTSTLLVALQYIPLLKIQSIHHLSVVLPWFLTFCLGVLVPAALSLWSFWRQYQQQLEASNPNHWRRRGQQPPQHAGTWYASSVGGGIGVCTNKRDARLRHMLQQRLQPYTQVLQHDDFVYDDEDDNNRCSKQEDRGENATQAQETTMTEGEERNAEHRYCVPVDESNRTTSTSTSIPRDSLDYGQWRLRNSPKRKKASSSSRPSTPTLCPSPSHHLEEKEEQAGDEGDRIVSGTCAICLNQYQEFDRVCWSANPDCVHCFHVNCMLSWLLWKPECPCCRQTFLPER